MATDPLQAVQWFVDSTRAGATDPLKTLLGSVDPLQKVAKLAESSIDTNCEFDSELTAESSKPANNWYSTVPTRKKIRVGSLSDRIAKLDRELAVTVACGDRCGSADGDARLLRGTVPRLLRAAGLSSEDPAVRVFELMNKII